MIELNESTVRNLFFQRISNNGKIDLSNNCFYKTQDEDEDKILKKIFLKPFQVSSSTFEFKHDIDLELNPLFVLSKSIYEESDFVDTSKNIYQHLKSVSKHPNIKDGDLFIVQYSDVKMDNTYYDALGIYKVENKDSFIEISTGKLTFKNGIGTRKLDKACLILFTKAPFTIFIIDNATSETDYWRNEFIKADYKNDNVNSTNNFLTLTKNFVTQCLPEGLEMSKADQIAILNNSIKFFKEKSDFNLKDFAIEVIEDPSLIEKFHKYKDDFERNSDFKFVDSFPISSDAVKKQTRALKSVIKLDKNFDIYIHGDHDLIEQGEDKKGKYYKVYYKEES